MSILALKAAWYVDISQFYTDDVKRHFRFFKKNPEKVWDALLPGVMDGTALNDFAPCRSHRPCKCKLQKADRHIGGMSCADMSAMNNGRPGGKGKTMLYFLAFAGLRRKVREPILVIENVDGFLSLLQLVLGDLYYADGTANIAQLFPSHNGDGFR